MQIQKFPYSKIPHLSKKDLMNLNETEKLSQFYQHLPHIDSFAAAIEAKSKKQVDRSLLVDKLNQQYQSLNLTDKKAANIKSLLDEKTYTVITAHQPSLFTGPLYTIYKIASAINLTERLKERYPENHFVPVFVTGGEDHDFDEINHVNVYGKTVMWVTHEWKGGSVGKLPIKSLADCFEEFIEIFRRDSEIGQWLDNNVKPWISENIDYGLFSRKLIDKIFSHTPLLVLSMDDEDLKRAFIPVMEKELFQNQSEKEVLATQQKLESFGWKAQAHPREINLFYRHEERRSRIVKEGETYKVLDSDISWSEREIKNHLQDHPDRFSPNVVLRPLFQEFIMPNLAYIGGGGEIAYWLERKSQFETFDIPFPMLIRRNSVLMLKKSDQKTMAKTEQSIDFFFQDDHRMDDAFLKLVNNEDDISLANQISELKSLIETIGLKAKSLDPTLESAVNAEGAKIEKQFLNLENKMKKAAKKKSEIGLNRIHKFRKMIFPENSLQERKQNIFPFISEFGWEIIDQLIQACDPLDKKFLVISP